MNTKFYKYAIEDSKTSKLVFDSTGTLLCTDNESFLEMFVQQLNKIEGYERYYVLDFEKEKEKHHLEEENFENN